VAVTGSDGDAAREALIDEQLADPANFQLAEIVESVLAAT
jgi:hypothetical protein